jgi:hypothetical protein
MFAASIDLLFLRQLKRFPTGASVIAILVWNRASRQVRKFRFLTKPHFLAAGNFSQFLCLHQLGQYAPPASVLASFRLGSLKWVCIRLSIEAISDSCFSRCDRLWMVPFARGRQIATLGESAFPLVHHSHEFLNDISFIVTSFRVLVFEFGSIRPTLDERAVGSSLRSICLLSSIKPISHSKPVVKLQTSAKLHLRTVRHFARFALLLPLRPFLTHVSVSAEIFRA